MAAPRKPLLLGIVLLVACSKSGGRDRVEPSFIEVSVEGETGTATEPLPFSSETATWTVSARTLDHNADPYPYEGQLKLKVRTGHLDQDAWVDVTGGEWTGEVQFHSSFGPTRIWVSDEGDKDQDSERAPSYATGVSEPIYYALPTIAEMNRIEDTTSNQLASESAEIRVSDREVIVARIGTDGIWVTDLLDAPGGYASLFIYTFSKPDGVALGDRLGVLLGNDQEYLGTTQISFPTYEVVEGENLPVPDPSEITSTIACDDALMESYESSEVYINNATIPSSFTASSEDYADYLEYGQWPIEVGSCTLYVESGVTAPDFDPTVHAGEDIGTVLGMVAQVYSKWIITVGGSGDIGVEDPLDAGTEGPPGPARPRARKDPGATHTPPISSALP